MEVTVENFQEVLMELDEILPKASFLGIDGEFTGLKTAIIKNSAFDTPAEYYSKMLSGSMDFLLIQLGLAVFTYDIESNRYNQRSYNFYVFPKSYNSGGPDCRFMCQASSITFLINQGFDFNKLFKSGIPYLTSAEEEKLTKRIEERNEIKDENNISISKEDQPRIKEICNKIQNFLESDAEELIIPYCNSYIRRLVHQEVRVMWPAKIKLDNQDNNIVVKRRGTRQEEEQREIERREKEKQEVKDAVGLSVLMKKIADSGKLIVGHNMLLDLFHIVHQFFIPLPEDYSEFKALLHNLFPRLLDTKIICQSGQFKEIVPSSNLNDLLETVSKLPFCIPEVDSTQNCSYTMCADKTHEAGYDAYITGLCFIALSNHLGSLQNPQISTVLADSPLLNPFINKLLIARLKDVPYINLVGNDPIPNRDNVFHLTFPKTWKNNDLYQLFKQHGGIQIGWINETSAYIRLNKREAVSQVNLNPKKNSNYTIQKYSTYQLLQQRNANFRNDKKAGFKLYLEPELQERVAKRSPVEHLAAFSLLWGKSRQSVVIRARVIKHEVARFNSIP